MAETEYYTTDDDRSLALPSSSDISYALPTLSASRRSSGRQTPSSITPSTPLTLPTEALADSQGHSGDKDDLDVRRFTPSLHASLVSEILALRRELDSKHTFIERLETNVSSLRTENEGLQENLAKHTKESRAVKKQLQSIEDGTLTAIEELVKERDDANATNAELKKKIESGQKKIRSQEEEIQRAQQVLEQDKSQWLDERRVLERKIHVSEGRLRAVIEEVAAHHEAAVADQLTQKASDHPTDSQSGAAFDQSSPTRPSHRDSVTSVYSVRNSQHDVGGAMGLSLAEELQQGEDEDGDADEEDQQNDTVDEGFSEQEIFQPKSRGTRRMLYQDDKARKILGMQSHSREQSLDSAAPDAAPFGDSSRNSGQFGSPKSPRRLHSSVDAHGELISGSPPGKVKQMVKRLSLKNQRASTPVPLIINSRTYRETVSGTTKYVSTGVQFSPPASPVASSSSPAWNTVWDSVFGDGHGEQQHPPVERDAYQQSKLESISTSAKGHSRTKSEPLPGATSTRRSLEEPLSPPASPELDGSPALIASNMGEASTAQLMTVSKILPVELREASTQTDTAEEPPKEEMQMIPSIPDRPPPAPPLTQVVPAIAIHPPDSVDSSSGDTVLPPGTRNMGCQTELNKKRNRSVAVQTEGIRVDKRNIKLPAHLLPSAISDNPVQSRTVKDVQQGSETTAIKYSQNVKVKSRDVTSTTPPVPPLPNVKDYYHITGDSEDSKWSRLKKSLRSHSNSDYVDEIGDAELSESDYTAQIPASRSSRSSKQGKAFDPPTPVPEDEKVVVNRTQGHKRGRASGGSRNSLDRTARNNAPTYQLNRAPYYGNAPNIPTRNGSRTPSLGSNVSSNQSRNSGPPPPYAIPTRSSSAGVTKYSRKKDSGSPTRINPRDSRDVNMKRLGKKPPVLRKVQSAAVLEEEKQSEDPYMMPPTPHSLASFPGSSPRTSNVTRSNASATQNGRARPSRQSSLYQQQYGAVTPTGNASVGSSVQHSVVDAITATMIGEWMWKYVRKRKSFGVSDQSQDFSKDARHRRWVWLSPYERTIMWSTKQPNSNAALMGKNGRTFAIQSVLDVKDETPVPKGATDIFARSILVLTPARALKFTATTRERHYLWLTALSFLAHHTQSGPLDLNFLPPLSSPHDSNSVASRSLASSSKQAHNTSLRISKDTSARSQLSSGLGTPTIQEVDSAQDNDEADVDPDSAFAPTVPRVPAHSRKRSSTNPHPGGRQGPMIRSSYPLNIGSPNNSLLSTGASISGRSSSGQAAVKSQASSSYAPSVRNVLALRSTNSSLKPSDSYNEEPNNPTAVPDGLLFTPEFTPRPSNVSEFGANNNFFDAVGMVRLDAFVSPGVNLDSKGAKSSSADGTAFQSRTGSRDDAGGGMKNEGRDTEPDLPISAAFSQSIWTQKSTDVAPNNTLHGKGEGSGESFIGPPNISRTRQGFLRRKGLFGGRADEEKETGPWKGF